MDAYLEALYPVYPDAIVISGGATGVDTRAEQKWLELGGQVVSLRVKKFSEDEYGIERWELGGPTPRVYDLIHHLTLADYTSALVYRDILIAEECTRCIAFMRPGGSRGTRATLDFAELWFDKPTFNSERPT